MFRKLLVILGIFIIIGLTGCATSRNAYFPATRKATGRRVFVFNPKVFAWAVYDEEGNLVRTGKASGGKNYCPELNRACRTTPGRYHILAKGNANCVSSKYPLGKNGRRGGGAPMPYCMAFSPVGYSIHGVADVPDYLNSHGCVSVSTSDARWLNEDFLKIGSTVIVEKY